MEEIYKKHPKFKCTVSNYGNVKGMKNKIMIGNTKRYHRITVRNLENKPCTVSVHRLVAELFIGDITNLVINHKDGNKLNNHVNNLEICTIKENIQHAFRTGLATGNKGVDNGNSILVDDDILEIYTFITLGYNNSEIAKWYNVDFRTISNIRNGKRWNHLFKKHLNEFIPSRSTKYDIYLCYEVIDKILHTDLKNAEIARLYNLDPSLVSRIRSKSTWKAVWIIYNRNATTIPGKGVHQMVEKQ